MKFLSRVFISLILLGLCKHTYADTAYKEVSIFSWAQEWRVDTDSKNYIYIVQIAGVDVFSTKDRTAAGRHTQWIAFLTESDVKNKGLSYAISYGGARPGGVSAAHKFSREAIGIEPIINPGWDQNTCVLLKIKHADGIDSIVKIIRSKP